LEVGGVGPGRDAGHVTGDRGTIPRKSERRSLRGEGEGGRTG